jgi:hypothetical protein
VERDEPIGRTDSRIELKAGEDYYIENGLLVMTTAYHRKRGYCCGSGCRHCPYVPRNRAGSFVLADDVDGVRLEPDPCLKGTSGTGQAKA